MSSKNLKKFLDKLDKELNTSSKQYRALVSDKKAHTFYISKQGLYEQVLEQAREDGVVGASKDIRKATNKFFTSMKRLAQKVESRKEFIVFGKDIRSDEFSITFRLMTTIPDWTRPVTNTFQLVKLFYQSAGSQGFFSEMREIYKGKGSSLDENKFLDIGHALESAVIKQRVYESILAFGEVPPALMQEPEVAAVFNLVKEDKLDTVVVSLESSYFNQLEGRAELKPLKEEIQAKIKAALQKLDTPSLKGSDSLKEKKTKEVHNILYKEFSKTSKKNKNVLLTMEKEKFKKSSKNPERLSKTSLVKSTHKGRKVKKSKAKKGVSSAPLFLIGVLNEQLPRVLEGNMTPPALQNRTGRFANSVTVTDIVTTPQGFPSIGYTYQKSPYQTFEPGFAQGSVERDPRRLIDKSIREIAIQYAIGRFYTRRQ